MTALRSATVLRDLERNDPDELLQRPIAPYIDGPLIVTGPADSFKITMLVSFMLGLVVFVVLCRWLFRSAFTFGDRSGAVLLERDRFDP